MLSCHVMAASHVGHADRGRQRLRPAGSRAITTFRKLPTTRPMRPIVRDSIICVLEASEQFPARLASRDLTCQLLRQLRLEPVQLVDLALRSVDVTELGQGPAVREAPWRPLRVESECATVLGKR